MTADELRNEFFEWYESAWGNRADLTHAPCLDQWLAFKDGHAVAADELDRLTKRVAELEARTSGLNVKYGRDHSSRMTIGQLAEKLLSATDSENFCDIIDAEFLFGCHKDTFDGPVNFWACKDVRGIVWHLVRQVQELRRYGNKDCTAMADAEIAEVK